MSSSAIDIRNLLIETFGISTPIFVGEEPSKPDEVITIFDVSSGEPPNPKWLIDEPEIQIRFRSNSYESAYNGMLNIRDILLGIDPFAQGQHMYVSIQSKHDVISMGRQNNHSTIMFCAFRIVREPDFKGNRERPFIDTNTDNQFVIETLGGPAQTKEMLDRMDLFVNTETKLAFSV